MKTAFFVCLLCSFLLVVGFGEKLLGQQADRIDRVNEFIADVRSGLAGETILRSYMESQGIYTSERMRTLSHEGVEYIRARIKATAIDSVSVYKYTDRPEKGRVRKPVEDPGSEFVEYAPLEFEIHVSPTEKQFNVETNDLYVMVLGRERYFILFNAHDQMIGFLGTQSGNRVAIMKF